MTQYRCTKEYTIQRLLANRYIVIGSNCWVWLGATDYKGYGRVSYQNKNYRVHVVAAIVWLDTYTTELQVCHKCGIKLCFNPDHIYMGTNSQNQLDRYRGYYR